MWRRVRAAKGKLGDQVAQGAALHDVDRSEVDLRVSNTRARLAPFIFAEHGLQVRGEARDLAADWAYVTLCTDDGTLHDTAAPSPLQTLASLQGRSKPFAVEEP